MTDVFSTHTSDSYMLWVSCSGYQIKVDKIRSSVWCKLCVCVFFLKSFFLLSTNCKTISNFRTNEWFLYGYFKTACENSCIGTRLQFFFELNWIIWGPWRFSIQRIGKITSLIGSNTANNRSWISFIDFTSATSTHSNRVGGGMQP